MKILWVYPNKSPSLEKWKKNNSHYRVPVCAFGVCAIYYKDRTCEKEIAVSLYHPKFGKSYMHRFMLDYAIKPDIREEIIKLLK